ncbi:hypothetical protein N7532_001194 [Penicillium argentinense]|uniref:Fe2OG dioxygenase domain-containing protein n=1 Tax=Penicillium argentinense TaxID=1131581 RepID=A0A9W9G206_9EURO|nr:uncharacterized protein N7532_001194 [Penicillium argentinense]KAJ5110659.1 hypothetical protein N7532_001194 [Penicillium argentinense]
MRPDEPPVIDFSPFYGTNESQKSTLIELLRHACEQFGFFQLFNHGITESLQQDVLQQSKEFFELPLEVKEKYNKDIDGFNRGYEPLRSQNFEKLGKGDLKEGFYMGKHLPFEDPYVLAKRFGQGPNKYPAELRDPKKFQSVMEEYHEKMTKLAENLLQVLAATLDLPSTFFDDFCEHPVAALRLLHYPPQDVAGEVEKGIGAHTDFGAITILLQDSTGGLQVWNNLATEWVDITPLPGAYVVNLGNMMMRWTNDRYLSNLHRVSNKDGHERFSVPFFFSGNPDYIVRCLPSCVDHTAAATGSSGADTGAKYPPVSVHDWMTGRFADTYNSGEKGFGDLRGSVVAEMK